MEKLGGEDGCSFDGVGSMVEAALAPWGFACLGSLSLGGGARSAPPLQQAEGAGGALGANPSQFGAVCFPAEQVGACAVNGAICAQGRTWDECLSCWLGALRGIGRLPRALGGEKPGNGSLAGWLHALLALLRLLCILVPGWVLEKPMLSAGPFPAARGLFLAGSWRRAALRSALSLPMSCVQGAAATLLRHGWPGRTRG